MKRFSIRIVYIFLLLLVVFFACKKKEKTAGGGKEKPITDSSYNLKDFVIQDASDGRILDFIDVHKIVQQNINEVANGNVVDTIYARIMVDITALKIKPRFYDLGRVTAIDPDTNEVRDLKKYDDQPYPTLKVTFNTGVARTFALVVSQAPANEDYSNLLKNQNIYFINEYKITNGTNEITYTPIRITNHQPILQQKDPIKDTIEFKVITSTAAGNKIVFAPFKYGVVATDTVVANLNPITLEFDPAIPNDYKDYKTMTITFANGFVREYAVKVTIVDPNTALNEDVYWMKTYTLTNKDGNTIPIGSIQEHQFTHHTPTSLVLQKDTIELTLPTTQWDLYPISFAPATWNGSSTPDTITYTTDQTDHKLVFPTRADTNQYKTLTVTFSNGFKREYAVKIHQIEKKSTEVSFSNFKVMDNGAPVSYIKLDTTGNTSTDGYTIINGNDSGVMIVRPLKDWHGNRQVTLQFTGLDPAVNATLAGYKGESIGNAGASLTTDGKITIDFSPINTDSVELVLQNSNEGGETRHYKIKLLSGMLKPTLIMDGTNTSTTAYTESVGKGNLDKEFKIAVDEKYVYVLILNRAGGKDYDTDTPTLIKATYDIYAYAITGEENATEHSKTSPSSATYKLNTDDKNIIDIVSINNTLYGVSLDASVLDASNKVIAQAYYSIYKWNNPIATNATPVQIGTQTKSSANNFVPFYLMGNSDGSDVSFYGCNSVGGNIANPRVSKISTLLDGTGTTTMKGENVFWTQGVTIPANSNGVTSFVDIPNSSDPTKGRSIILANNGGSGQTIIFGKTDFSGQGTGTNYAFTSSEVPLISGSTMQMERDNNYLFISSMKDSKMSIISFGKNIANTMDEIGNEVGNSKDVSTKLFSKTTYSEEVGIVSKDLSARRGNVRTYKMKNGKIRIVSLISSKGFKVWDME